MSGPSLETSLARLATAPTYGAYLAVAGALDRLAPDPSRRPALKIAILRNFTVDGLLPVLKGEVALSGFHPDVQLTGYDTVIQTALDERSDLYSGQPDIVIVTQWLEGLSPDLSSRYISLSPEQAADEVERILAGVVQAVAAIRERLRAPVLVTNFPLPLYPALGILDGQSAEGQTSALLRLNLELRSRLKAFADVHVVDLMSMVSRLGSHQAIDARYWQIGRAPLSRSLLLALGQELGKFIRALHGKARKCLVLDCDNVLWGGVVGEDGIDAIQIGPTYPGSQYLAFQRDILNLHDRGVLLALCSKNNEADVMEVLRQHPDMLLREQHFATWQINWEDKATNLRRIAGDLNIGVDSLVFADDSAFECDFVRQQLPEAAVLHLAGDPSSFPAALNLPGYFDTVASSSEDRARNLMYRADKERKVLAASAGSLSGYLATLEMRAEISRAEGPSITRAAQLTQKTNQFNLTTRRYSEGDIQAFVANPDADVLVMRLADRVADLGIIGVAVVNYGGDAVIDTFLLSCRALGRGAEQALLARVCEAAISRGCARLIGRYEPTPKNGQVANFYRDQGFDPVTSQEQGSDWALSLASGRIASPEWFRLENAPPITERSESAEQ